MARVPTSKQTRNQLEQLFEGRGAAEGDRGELVKLAARLIVEEALEEEVEDVIGRGYYAHGDGSGGQELLRDPNVRVHDLKHTFGHRLEAAGTTFGDCQVLLGHRPRTVTQRYMVAEIARLIEAAERVLETERRTTVPLTIIRRKAA